MVGHPFDTIKVRLQTEKVNNFGGKHHFYKNIQNGPRGFIKPMIQTTARILRNEGPRGFFKGMLLPICAGVPWCAATFYGYSLGERLYENNMQNSSGFSNQKVMVAGTFAGCFNATVACPIERIKCLLQVQQNSKSSAKKYSGPFNCAYQVYKEGGVSNGLFRGYSATMLRRGPGYLIHFIVYENIKEMCRKRKRSDDLSGPELMAAGGIAGIVSCLYWVAPDTLKTRVQTAPAGKYPNGMRSVIREIRIGKEGFSSLYRGLPPAMIRAFPTCAVYMFSYEYFVKQITKRNGSW